MATISHLKVGDLLIRFGKILKISSVRPETIELRPFFNLKSNHDLTYSIPVASLNLGQVRYLVTPAKLTEIWKTLLLSSTKTPTIDVVETKTTLNTHELAESLLLIKVLWLEKQAHAGFLPSGRLNLFQQALTQASEEIAAVKGILPEKAKLLILSTLKKGLKDVPPAPKAN